MCGSLSCCEPVFHLRLSPFPTNKGHQHFLRNVWAWMKTNRPPHLWSLQQTGQKPDRHSEGNSERHFWCCISCRVRTASTQHPPPGAAQPGGHLLWGACGGGGASLAGGCGGCWGVKGGGHFTVSASRVGILVCRFPSLTQSRNL